MRVEYELTPKGAPWADVKLRRWAREWLRTLAATDSCTARPSL